MEISNLENQTSILFSNILETQTETLTLKKNNFSDPNPIKNC